MRSKSEILKLLEERKKRSAWEKAVVLYAFDLMENVEDRDLINVNLLKKALLCGASNWKQYSEGGCSLTYDYDIAERVCTPSEFKKTKEGRNNPNSRENWIDTQARALYQACDLIIRLAKD
jgi:hypothetical protein